MPKISALPNLTTPDGADELPLNDASATTTKKITLTVLKEWFQSLTSWITTAMIGNSQVTNSKVDLSTFGYTPVKYDFSSTINRTRTSATPAAVTGATAQSFTSRTGRVKVTIGAAIAVNTETGQLGVFKSDTSTYTSIVSTNGTTRDFMMSSAFFTVTPGVAIDYTPYFLSQSGSSTITIYPYTQATMIVEDVV